MASFLLFTSSRDPRGASIREDVAVARAKSYFLSHREERKRERHVYVYTQFPYITKRVFFFFFFFVCISFEVSFIFFFFFIFLSLAQHPPILSNIEYTNTLQSTSVTLLEDGYTTHRARPSSFTQGHEEERSLLLLLDGYSDRERVFLAIHPSSHPTYIDRRPIC